jgi:hypothetical protein
VKNWNTDDTGLTDDASTGSAQIFFCPACRQAGLQKNLDRFGDPPSCEAGKSCVYPISKADYWGSKLFKQ